jgi:hypothetical protein
MRNFPRRRVRGEPIAAQARVFWPKPVAGDCRRGNRAQPQGTAADARFAEALGAAVIDSDGRYAFPSTHVLNLTARKRLCAGPTSCLPGRSQQACLGPSVRERGFARSSPSCKVIHITMLVSNGRAMNDNMWLLPVHVPIAADTSVCRSCRTGASG